LPEPVAQGQSFGTHLDLNGSQGIGGLQRSEDSVDRW
jgi:hypothetical protein